MSPEKLFDVFHPKLSQCCDTESKPQKSNGVVAVSVVRKIPHSGYGKTPMYVCNEGGERTM
jgi:hypothetical protein